MNTDKNRNQGRRALGKGLDALIPGASAAVSSAPPPPRDYFKCPVARLQPDPEQPRKKFDKDSLDELVASIKEHGVIEPLIVRRATGDNFYIICGERRWRAAQLGGLKELPVVIKDVTDLQAFEMALVENIQREDLNAIEEAEAISRLISEHNYTQAQVATRIGRDRSTISNSLRLLSLPLEIKTMVLDRELTEGHARAVLQAGSEANMITLAKMVLSRGFSVRETERHARLIATGPAKAASAAAKVIKPQSPQVKSLLEKLQRALNAKVEIHDNKGKGRLAITYTSYEELDGIIDRILR